MIRVGLIDSGINSSVAAADGSSCGFQLQADGSVTGVAARADRLGHGSALAGIILRGTADASLFNAQVFTERLSCSAAQVAAALNWLVGQEVRLVNMSFGLRVDRKELRHACAMAEEAGVIMIASSPARGEPVYPASYANVIRATGDARCSAAELSLLQTAQADFGAYVRCDQSSIAGASVACAHLSAMAVKFLSGNPRASAEDLREWLGDKASYRGPERRLS